MEAQTRLTRSSLKRIPTLGILFLLSLVLSACGLWTDDAKPVSVQLHAQESTIAISTQLQMALQATCDDGSLNEVTSKASWSSSNKSVATIDDSGLVTALSAGDTTIDASYKGFTASFPLKVKAATIVLIQVTPNDISIAKNFQQQFVATAQFDDGSKQDISGQVFWSATPSTTLEIDEQGLATAIAPGPGAIVAQLGQLSGAAVVTVSDASLSSISLTAPTKSLPLGHSLQLQAIGIFSDDSKRDITDLVDWSTSSKSIASIDNDSKKGFVQSNELGSVSFSVSYEGISASESIEISSAVLQEINIEPANVSLPLGLKHQFSALGIFSDGSSQDLTSQVTWTSSDGSVSSLSNIDIPGEFIALAQGTSSISASFGDVSKATSLNVTVAEIASISVEPGSVTIAKGLSQPFSAIANYTDGIQVDVTKDAIWGSLVPTVATVDFADQSAGIVSAREKGKTLIIAQLGSIIGSSEVVVSDAVLSSLHISPLQLSLANGQQQQYQVTGLYSDQTSLPLTDEVSWSVSDDSVASISNAKDTIGKLTGLKTGAATVMAKLNGVTGSSSLTVSDAVLSSIEIEPSIVTVPKGVQQVFIATGQYSDGSYRDISDSVIWQTNDASIATIYNSGDIIGLSETLNEGSVTISATLGELQGTSSLTVNTAVLNSIEVSAEQNRLANGLAQQMYATGIYSDKSHRDITADVNWSSSNISLAVVSNDTAHAGWLTTRVQTSGLPADVDIIAQTGEISASTTITITSAILSRIDIVSGSTSIAKGHSIQLSATGIMSNGNTVDLTQQTTWVSADSAIANVGDAELNKGLLSALAKGSTTIHAIYSGVRSSVDIQVTDATLSSLTITPDNLTLPLGLGQQLTVTGTYSDSTTVDLTKTAEWSTSSSAITLGNRVDPGFVNTLSIGSATVNAAVAGITTSTTITVSDVSLQSISITSPADTLYQGFTLQYSATGQYSDSSTQDITSQVLWSTSDAGLATVSNATGTHGLVSGSGTRSGAVDIKAELGSVNSSRTLSMTYDTNIPVELSVVPFPNITLNSSSDTQTYFARLTGVDANAAVADQFIIFDVSQNGTTVDSFIGLTVGGLLEAERANTFTTTGIANVTASVNGFDLQATTSIYVTNDLSDAIGSASASNIIKTTDTVDTGSSFSFSIVNFSNREFSLNSYEFTNSGQRILYTDDAANLNNNTLGIGQNITITTTLSAPQSGPFDFIGSYSLTDKNTGTTFSVSKTFTIP